MKTYIKVFKSIAFIFGAVTILFPVEANARKFAVKAYGDIGLIKPLSITSGIPGMTAKSSAYSFGADFGYAFWQKGANSLEANIGLGYTVASATFDVAALSYDYAAPASADEDGNAYRRFVELSAMSQKTNFGYLNIPIYLQYQYRINNWLGVHADLGFGLGFKCSGSTGDTSGKATSYGVYPEYDDLVIKADYLNDFGDRELSDAKKGEASYNGFSANVMCGAGFEFFVAEPVSIDLGIRYRAGLTQVFNGQYDVAKNSEFNAESAPVTYSVAEGTVVKSFADYNTKSRLNPLSLHIGITVRF